MADPTPVKTGLMSIGEEAKPPAVVLPDPALVFLNRAKRLEGLAAGHVIEGYLRLVAAICRAQASVAAALPPLPAGVPRYETGAPLQDMAVDEHAEAAFSGLLRALQSVDAPDAFKDIVKELGSASSAARRLLLETVLGEEEDAGDAARHTLAHAALQIHAARRAAALEAASIAPVDHGPCPVCARPPAASAVVSWPMANNTRFCTCSLCASQWHVVRLKCVSCGTTAGISYPHIEGQADGLRAETCEACRSYLKIVYQTRDPLLEPFADDIASLDLDLVMKREGWTRGGSNAFLIGY